MNRTTITLALIVVALLGVMFYFNTEVRQLKAEIGRLGADSERVIAENVQLRERLQNVESQLEDINTSDVAARAVCNSQFPSGLYRLVTETSYGPGLAEEYEIHHVSIFLAEWNINVGMRMDAPSHFYLDYNGDGRVDTVLAARFVREIPWFGKTMADRLVAGSRVQQNLYAVFSCEWKKAEYTSSEDMRDRVSRAPSALWDLVEEYSEMIVEWIRGSQSP